MKDWRQEAKGTTEDEMVRWHHGLLDMSLNKLQELVMDREAWCAAVQVCWGHRVRHDLSTELNWTDWKKYIHVLKRTSRVWLSAPWIRKLVLGVNWELISYLSRKTVSLEWRWEATNKCCWTSWILQDKMIELFSCEVCYTLRQVMHDSKGDSDRQGWFLRFKNGNLWFASNKIDCSCLNYWRQGCLTKT